VEEIMAIPDFQTLMLPLLRFVADGQEKPFREAVEVIAQEFSLTEAERAELLPSRRAPLFYNRLAWAKAYLKKAGLVDQSKRGVIKISAQGEKLLSSKPQKITLALLQQLPEFQANQNAEDQLDSGKPLSIEPQSGITPEESLERAHETIRKELVDEILGTVKKCSPAFFENLVVQLMLKMGYGGSRQEAGRAVGRTGDGGIDGIINEDRLGLDAIYLQAKRWEGTVGRPEIMRFVGALAGQRASKGVFITTSSYSQEAKEYAASSQYKVVLLDGYRLADLMIEHNLGVSVEAVYQVKKLDSDFFSDE
jgi:restriction system protein